MANVAPQQSFREKPQSIATRVGGYSRGGGSSGDCIVIVRGSGSKCSAGIIATGVGFRAMFSPTYRERGDRVTNPLLISAQVRLVAKPAVEANNSAEPNGLLCRTKE